MFNSIKKMILIGAAVAVMMSFAAPAMADDFGSLKPSHDYGDIFNPEPEVVGPSPKQKPCPKWQWDDAAKGWVCDYDDEFHYPPRPAV
jgi:hypothetical protein